VEVRVIAGAAAGGRQEGSFEVNEAAAVMTTNVAGARFQSGNSLGGRKRINRANVPIRTWEFHVFYLCIVVVQAIVHGNALFPQATSLKLSTPTRQPCNFSKNMVNQCTAKNKYI
jgi:hypothetical protein